MTKFDDLFRKPEPPAAPVIPHPAIVNTNGSTPYGAKALAEELAILASTTVESHRRNTQLNDSAFNLAQLVASGHLNATTTYDQLRATALAIGLTVSETDATLRSAFRAGTQQPRDVPQLPSNVEVVEVQVDPETGEPINPSQTAEQTNVDRRQLQIESLYITHEGLAHIKPPEPIIEDWLYRNSLAWLAGKPGDAKSFIALDMAYSVATGTPWQGHPTTQGTVFYIAAEGATGLSIRADAWCKAHNNPTNIPIRYLPLAVRLTNPVELDAKALAQALKALQPALIIIDTQARVTTGAEENSAKDMGWFIDTLETLRAAHPATYLTVHHTPRSGDNLRGSIALEGAAETVLLSVKDGNIVTLKCQKQKNAAEPDDFQMYMQPIGDSIIMDYKAVEVIKEMTPAMEIVLKTVLELYGDTEVSSSDLEKASGISGGTYTRAKQTLVRDGFLAERKSGLSKFYKVTGKTHLHYLQLPPT